jgi:hypothetical protein
MPLLKTDIYCSVSAYSIAREHLHRLLALYNAGGYRYGICNIFFQKTNSYSIGILEMQAQVLTPGMQHCYHTQSYISIEAKLI